MARPSAHARTHAQLRRAHVAGVRQPLLTAAAGRLPERRSADERIGIPQVRRRRTYE